MSNFVTLLPTLLIGALALIMFGLGLSLTVGLMLLAASPGGVSANLFSHLFGGNVAMNISLTAINTVLSIVSLPLIANFAIDTFAKSGQVVPMQTAKVVEVILIVLIPVAIGMFVKNRAPGFAARMDKPMKRFSMAVLALLAVVAIAKEWTAITTSFASIGLAVILFNVASLGLGYYVPRMLGLDRSNAIAIGYEIGIHNSTLAIFVAVSVLGDFQLMLPAAIYSVSMYVFATAFGFLVLGRNKATAGAAAPAA